MTRAESRRVLVCYGTRPEAIKVAPVIHALRGNPGFEPVVVVTGQHRAMLDQVNALFDITPDVDLDIHAAGQTLDEITSRILTKLTPVLQDRRPDAVLVQGDTSSCFAASLAAAYLQIPVFHLEAGLRTGNLANPFPEELNRRLTGALAALHLAPTSLNRANLLAEGVPEATIVVTGNTVIDALHHVLAQGGEPQVPELRHLPAGRVILVTAHRRESLGEPMRRTAQAIAHLAGRYPDVTFVLPLHLNPRVRDVVVPVLGDVPNVVLLEPLGYADLAWLLERATIVVTDSGGIQEEAPGLGKPVLVLRDTTERPEALRAGTVRLVGTDPETIIAETGLLLDDPKAYEAMARAVNPYGDGAAAARCIGAMAHYFGDAPPPAEFAAATVMTEAS